MLSELHVITEMTAFIETFFFRMNTFLPDTTIHTFNQIEKFGVVFFAFVGVMASLVSLFDFSLLALLFFIRFFRLHLNRGDTLQRTLIHNE